jgi:hypothetical protein
MQSDQNKLCRQFDLTSSFKYLRSHISVITPIENDEELIQITPEEVFAGEPKNPLIVKTSQALSLSD